MLKNFRCPPNKIHTTHHALHSFALLLSPVLTIINQCLEHIELLNISHVYHVLSQLQSLYEFFSKIILWLCRTDACPAPYALGAPTVALLWPPFCTRQATCGPRLLVCPLDHTHSAQGSGVFRPKNPSLLLGPLWASSHVPPPEGSPHHQPDPSRLEGGQETASCGGAEVNPVSTHGTQGALLYRFGTGRWEKQERGS